ncbi:hypothetical protein PF005_g29948 [Phytophthora fragariae]|nr:hypothetical protein PF005_g29948 [Phytophthora fragariae]
MGGEEETVAISSASPRESGPAQKKRRVQVKTAGMHEHFANLVDEEITDVAISIERLQTLDDRGWEPRRSFARIKDDMLLYLAILGGKTYPTYYDLISDTNYSTKWAFSIVKANAYVTAENTQAPTLNYKKYRTWSLTRFSVRREEMECEEFLSAIFCLASLGNSKINSG